MNATARRSVAFVALCLAAAQATAQTDRQAWPKWQARLGVTTSPQLGAGPRLQGASLMGDYYITGPGFGAGRVGGGLRATSGLLTGARAATLGSTALPSAPGAAFTLSARRSLAATPLLDVADGGATTPYLGLGYTGSSLRGGWGFTADIGLMGLAPAGSGLRLGRGPAQPLDDLLRDLRLTPVLQLGVSYQF